MGDDVVPEDGRVVIADLDRAGLVRCLSGVTLEDSQHCISLPASRLRLRAGQVVSGVLE